MKHIISMNDISREQIDAVLDVADDVKRAIHDQGDTSFKTKYGCDVRNILEEAHIATMFREVSTRTKFSFRAAAALAGSRFIDGFPTEEHTSLGKGETWAATAEMFMLYGFNVLVMRSKIEGLPRWTLEALEQRYEHLASQHERLDQPFGYKLPMIINGGDGTNQHPTQCFLDLFTMREFARSSGKDLDGLDLGLLNDLKYGRTIASLMSVAHHYGFKLHLAHHNRFGPPQHRLDDLARKDVEVISHGDDFLSALEASFIAYQSRPQKERVGVGEDLIGIKELGQITAEMYEKLGDKAPFLMHPLPIDAETFEEIDHQLLFHPKYIAPMQASNGIYARIAMMAIGLGVIEIPDGLTSKITEMIIQELRIDSGKSRLENPPSGYIDGNGLVFDHIPGGMGRRLVGMLGLEDEQISKTLTDYLSSRIGVKDMLKIHSLYNLSDEQCAAVALIAPDITISQIENGVVTRKFRPVLGNSVQNLISCGNDACVTNVRRENVITKHWIQDSDKLRIVTCKYCEVSESIDDIFHNNRFIYFGQN